MADQGSVDDVLQRVGLAAMMYYPEIPVEEPSYSLEQDVAWCLEPLAGDPAAAERVRRAVGLAIVDPTAHRAGLFEALQSLVAGQARPA